MPLGRTVSEEVQEALEARRLVARDFLWITVKDRADNSPLSFGFWSDIGNVDAEVINPNTNSAVTRTFEGAGGLIEIDDIPLVANLQVQTIRIKFNQINDQVNTLIRTYNMRQAPIEIFRGQYDPDTMSMVAPATPRFVGFVDTIEWDTPEAGNEGAVIANCTSHTQEMTRANPDTRSDASQRLRDADDEFYKDTSTAGEWEIWWGTYKGQTT